MENKQKTTTNIKAADASREMLKKHFGHCFDKNGDFDFEKFKQEFSVQEINFYKESYGLDWLGKSYSRVLASDETTTLLKEDRSFNQKEANKNSENILIKGDNLEVLKHLSNAYYEKIKMIYIDPPYNTGNDGFTYQDSRKFTAPQLAKLAGIDEERAKKILDFTQSNSNSHSAWLTFMYPRLYIAKQLLTDDGVIFISIDDNEVSQLRLLMDEIFGEENFVGEIIRKTKSMTADKNTGLNLQHEYLLIFAKSINELTLRGEEKDYRSYKNTDNDPKGLWTSGDPSAKSGGDSTYFPIKNPNTNNIDYPPKGRFWAFSKTTLNDYISSGKIKFKKEVKKNERGFIFKRYKKDLSSVREPVNSLFASDSPYMNNQGTVELNKLFDKRVFDNPKPVIFIKQLVKFSTNPTDIILDFFGGSGTSGEAALQLNAEDGGRRRYILVQLAEEIDAKKSKGAYEFVRDELLVSEPTIFDVTKERLLRAAKKIQAETIDSRIGEKRKELEYLEGSLDLDERGERISMLNREIDDLQKQDLGFKIFETIPIWENFDFDAEEMDRQTEIFDAGNLTVDDLQSLLITWKSYDGIALTKELEEISLGEYVSYYGDGKLYLMNQGFKTENLKKLLEKIDSDKLFNPTSIIAFGYNFDSKNLKEIADNIKSYSNKKSIDLDFIIRY